MQGRQPNPASQDPDRFSGFPAITGSLELKDGRAGLKLLLSPLRQKSMHHLYCSHKGKPLSFPGACKAELRKLEMPCVLPEATPSRLEDCSEYKYLCSDKQVKVADGGLEESSIYLSLNDEHKAVHVRGSRGHLQISAPWKPSPNAREDGF